MEDVAVGGSTFCRRWIAANGWAEAVGLGTTFVVGAAIAPHVEAVRGPAGVLAVAAAAVMSGIVLEGIVVGFAQGRVLRLRLPTVSLGSWITATAIGAGVAWVLGMIPSTVMALAAPGEGGSAMQEPAVGTQLALAAALGAVTGPVLGGAQWLVLRRHVERAGLWLVANAGAWGVGMVVIFAGMDRVPWTGSILSRSVSTYAVCLVAGLAVGAIHGPVLVRLTERSPSCVTTGDGAR